MIEFVYDAPPGERMARYGFGVQIDSQPGEYLRWVHKERRWMAGHHGYACSNTAPCRTLKAFKRHIRRHAKDLAGCKVRWVNRYMGCDVVAVVGGAA